MNKFSILILILVSITCSSQIPDGFPLIGKTELPDARFQPARHFTGESLIGYMNGGAELYREYGITDAMITEFDINGRYYKCEVFKMAGPEEAFGIYSVTKFRCLNSPSISPYACQTKYQLQICKGPYYISIINRSGTLADSAVLLKTGTIFKEKINESSVDLSAFIPDVDPENLKHNTILAKGKLGLISGATGGEDYFKDMENYYTLIYKGEEKTILSVRFTNPEDFITFINFHGWGLCDMSVSDVTLSGGETLRILGDNHLLIKISK